MPIQFLTFFPCRFRAPRTVRHTVFKTFNMSQEKFRTQTFRELKRANGAFLQISKRIAFWEIFCKQEVRR